MTKNARGYANVMGSTVSKRDATRLTTEIISEYGPCLAALRGDLTLRTAGSTSKTLTKLLLNHGEVMVDLSRLHVGWAPALQVFPTALASAGSWPFARLVLFDANAQVTAALHRVRVPTMVPLAQGAREARAHLARRPDLVMRHYELAHDPSSPRRARALVRQACSDWDLAAVAGKATLVANELVRNAIQHTRSPSRLRITVDDEGLRLAVRDFLPGQTPWLRQLCAAGVSGSGGLHVVAAMSRRWGVTPCSDGKSVWAVLGVDPPGEPERSPHAVAATPAAAPTAGKTSGGEP